MRKRKIRKTTTISCDESSRKFIAAEAERTGRLQREVLAEMISFYELHLKRVATKEKEQETRRASAYELFEEINKKLDKAIKRDDTVIAFIREQERSILNPTRAAVDEVKAAVDTIVNFFAKYK